MKLEGRYVIVRSNSAGVFAGILTEKDGGEVVLTDCRRIWYWDGAATLSQLAAEGVKRPNLCKFTMPIEEILVREVVEIIPTTDEAEKIIREVPIWKV